MKNERFLVACKNERPDRVPAWFMRQAGRSLPEYRDLRAHHHILEICRTPELAAEATLQPVRRLGVDAAILFSDIVVPLQEMGVALDIVEGVGPSIAHPIATDSDLSALHRLDEDGVVPVNEAVELLASELEVPLIGFGGAPYTLACYLIDGGSSKNHTFTKAMMHGS
ncbi:MAG: uroporphyrinogen decarboxylase, partial [Actinomycetota bacterium]|nr:uroporphyrinogen decarboxylase [Actinomycetota bacterium]